MISVDFHFTAKQTPVNDENILRKIFYVETNGALAFTSNVQVLWESLYYFYGTKTFLGFKPVTLKTDKSTSAYTQITHEFTWFSKEPISMGGDEKRDSLRKQGDYEWHKDFLQKYKS